MASRNKTNVPCDRKGNPLKPNDVSWQTARNRACVILPVGAALIPFGLLMYLFAELPEYVRGLRLVFGMILFLGVLFLLYGAFILVLSLVQRAKMPPRDEQIRYVTAEGVSALATVVCVKHRRRVRNGKVFCESRAVAEYYDKLYDYNRVFVSEWEEIDISKGDKVRVYYRPESNIGYFVDMKM